MNEKQIANYIDRIVKAARDGNAEHTATRVAAYIEAERKADAEGFIDRAAETLGGLLASALEDDDGDSFDDDEEDED